MRYTGTSSLAVEMATESFGLCRVTHQCSNQRSACGLKTCSSTRGSVVDIAERNAMDQAPDLKQRFEREAKTISSLNHPHICTLYDIGSQGGIDFLVMEYLEGEPLALRR